MFSCLQKTENTSRFHKRAYEELPAGTSLEEFEKEVTNKASANLLDGATVDYFLLAENKQQVIPPVTASGGSS